MHLPGRRLVAVATLVVLCASAANAHTILASITTDGTNLKVGECIRAWWSHPAGPVQDVTSPDLRCRTTDMSGAKTKTCPVAAGSEMLAHFTRALNKDAGVISQSHTGPVMVYIAPLSSNGEGDVWVKIYEDGWDKKSNEWGTDRLIANKGTLTFKIPADIKPGDYLLRTEVIALHNASTKGGAQLFPNCVQIKVTGNGKNTLPKGVAFPGAYKDDDPGILYKRKKFGDNSSYVIPGPPVYKGTGGGQVANVPTDTQPEETEPTSRPHKPACVRKRKSKRQDL